MRFFPILAGSVVIGYNLPGVDSSSTMKTLNMSRNNIANIYLSIIVDWADPLIGGDNPYMVSYFANHSITTLPIVTIRRADSSGTTQIFTTALTSFSAAWAATYKAFQTPTFWSNGSPSGWGKRAKSNFQHQSQFLVAQEQEILE